MRTFLSGVWKTVGLTFVTGVWIAWVVRHDLDTGYGNRDHVLAGPAVYLLDTKHHIDDRLALEGTALRVQRVDQPRDAYLLDGITPAMKRAAGRLSDEIFRDTGQRVWVYPVVVLWGYFDEGVAEAGGVFYVDGEKVAGWLRSRPTDLHNRRREVVETWLRGWQPSTSRVARLSPARVKVPSRARGRD